MTDLLPALAPAVQGFLRVGAMVFLRSETPSKTAGFYGPFAVIFGPIHRYFSSPTAACQNFLMRAEGSLEDLSACADIILKSGENVTTYRTGGVGYGPPHERLVEKVRNDVEEKWITKERAFEVRQRGRSRDRAKKSAVA